MIYIKYSVKVRRKGNCPLGIFQCFNFQIDCAGKSYGMEKQIENEKKTLIKSVRRDRKI